MMGFLDQILHPQNMQEAILLFLSASVAVLLVMVIILAAITIRLRDRNNRQAEWWKRLETKWEPLILDALGGTRTIDEVVALVEPSESFYYLEMLQRYSTRIRGAETALIFDLAKPFIHKIIARLDDKEPPRRARAVRTLSVLDEDNYTHLIIRALDDESPLVAMVAARALAQNESADQAKSILKYLDRFDSWSPNFIISMLTSIGPEIAGDLRGVLLNENHSIRARAVAAGALKELRDYESADAATAVLKTESARDLLTACLRLLGEVGQAIHLDPIRSFLTGDDPVLRGMALAALGSIGDEEDIPRLIKGISDDHEWAAIGAARGVLKLGGAAVLEQALVRLPERTKVIRMVLGEA